MVFLIYFVSCKDKVVYLDNSYPDLTPKLYAVGIINTEGRFQQNLTMSPDGKEHLFTVTDSELWIYESILRVRNNGVKIVVDTPSFVTNFKYKSQQFIGEPMISPDNQNLFFIADYPPNIWRAKRMGNEDWSQLTEMTELSTQKDDWYVTISQNDNLYFTNGTVYKSTLKNGNYESKTKLESHFNQKDTRDPCISPDEDYMIFTADDSLSTNQSDLFISFNDGNGNWSKPQSLGNKINTEHREFAPYISPDEKYLFFSRRDKWQNAEFSNIYWVSLKIIDKFRN